MKNSPTSHTAPRANVSAQPLAVRIAPNKKNREELVGWIQDGGPQEKGKITFFQPGEIDVDGLKVGEIAFIDGALDKRFLHRPFAQVRLIGGKSFGDNIDIARDLLADFQIQHGGDGALDDNRNAGGREEVLEEERQREEMNQQNYDAWLATTTATEPAYGYITCDDVAYAARGVNAEIQLPPDFVGIGGEFDLPKTQGTGCRLALWSGPPTQVLVGARDMLNDGWKLVGFRAGQTADGDILEIAMDKRS